MDREDGMRTLRGSEIIVNLGTRSAGDLDGTNCRSGVLAGAENWKGRVGEGSAAPWTPEPLSPTDVPATEAGPSPLSDEAVSTSLDS